MAPHSQEPPGHTAVEQMLALLNGHCLEQGLYVVASLGIADLLDDHGMKTVNELAEAVGANSQSLYRLLRALASVGVREGPRATFGLTALGATLRTDAPNSVRDRALFYGAPRMWNVWSQLLHSVRTGESACEHVYGLPFYDYASHDPEIGRPFNRYMSQMSEMQSASMVESYDFTGIGIICDVAGGLGTTLATILHKYPRMKGILFDRPGVVEQAPVLRIPGLAGCCEIVGGDMHKAVPVGADAYLIKWVMMDRSDEQAIMILTNCRDATAIDGRVLLVDPMIPQEDEASFNKVLDVQMLLLFGRGRIRTEDEYRNLFEASGLRLTRLVSTRSPNTILEAIRT